MAWRLAKSLDHLADEIEAAYPGTTVWDIGDAAHQSGWSDHNPNVCCDVVCGIDVLGDGGMSLSKFVAHLLANPHPNLRYVIYNRKIYQRKNGWEAQDYNGVNAHKTHVHVSVGNGPDGRSTSGYDNTATWKIADMGAPVPSGGVPAPTLREGDATPAVGQLQRALNDALGLALVVDDVYGPKTTTAVRELQRRTGIAIDGIYGRDAASALRDLLEDDMNLSDKIAYTKWYRDTYGPTSGTVGTTLAGVIAYGRNASDNSAKMLKLQEAVLAKVAGADTKSILDAINKRGAEDAARDASILAAVAELASGGATAQEVYDLLVSKLTAGAGE